MNRIFSMDTPIMRGFGRILDIVILNLLFVICSIPVVTAGASMAAMFSVTLRLVRDEEAYIVESFFRSFKRNFKISTAVWGIVVITGVILTADYRIIPLFGAGIGKMMKISLAVMAVLYILLLTFVFPYIARFEDTLKDTLKNALLIGIANFPYSVAILLISAIPVGVTWMLGIKFSAVLWLLGLFAADAYMESILYRKVFDKYITENNNI